jgi:hypothetical protein
MPTSSASCRDPRIRVEARERAQPEAHVLAHREVRKQRVVLEHHADAPVLGRELVSGTRDDFCVDQDFARAHRLEAGDAAQQRRLAASARSEDARDPAARERERHVGNDDLRVVCVLNRAQLQDRWFSHP